MDFESFPTFRGRLEYVCQNCGTRFPVDQLLYTCPKCGGVFLIEDVAFADLDRGGAENWRETFDLRRATNVMPLRGVFRFYELLAPVFEPEDIVYLGEANTPLIEASERFRAEIGVPFGFKNDGQNPSASFKDRGMACAFSCIKWLCRIHGWDEVLTICASTGDTSAAAALYAAYVGAPVKSVVILPKGKVTPQQLSQPLGSGATVIEIPGVFDDCMKVVETLAENYRVALLNSKNSWRILGQETYAYEIASHFRWDMRGICLFVPIGNAGNITAIVNGFLKLKELGVIDNELPYIFGVQSAHADPVCRYYEAPPSQRIWSPVEVRPSVAQAAMIGDPVSFPRLRNLADKYTDKTGENKIKIIRVSEQEIIDSMLQANRHGHIACTQGGECLAGLKIAIAKRLLPKDPRVVLDSTAHALKFMDFQNRYFNNELAPEYEITPRPELINMPLELLSEARRERLSRPEFAKLAAETIAEKLDLKRRGNENN